MLFQETLLSSPKYTYPRIAMSNHDTKACIYYTGQTSDSNNDLYFSTTSDCNTWEHYYWPDDNSNETLADIYYMPHSTTGDNFHVAWWESGYIKYKSSDDLNNWTSEKTVSDDSNNSDDDFVSVCASSENQGMVAWVHGTSSNYDICFDGGNLPPDEPSNPSPSDNQQNVSVDVDLEWDCSDPDGDDLWYTVYFEKNDSSPNDIVKNDATGSNIDLNTLDYSSHYYWQVKADDHKGGVTTGPVWDFYTESAPDISILPENSITIYNEDKRKRDNTSWIEFYPQSKTNNEQLYERHSLGGKIEEDEIKYISDYKSTYTYDPKLFPTAMDWSVYDSPVKNQFSCGSCWAFAATAFIENLGDMNDLSEQVVISCSDGGDCEGGFARKALEYFKNYGVPEEDCYQYLAQNGNCVDKCEYPAYLEKISTTSHYLWELADVNDLKNELQSNPIIVRMLVPDEFHTYQGGTIFDYDGGEIPDTCGHIVLLVGYNDDQECFKAKNSWGTYWGEDGYFRISYDDVTDDVQFGSYALKGSGVYTEWLGFQVENLGEGVLELTSIECNKSWATISPAVPPELQIDPGESKGISIIINWDEITVNQDIATITFNSNDPDEPMITRNVIAQKTISDSLPLAHYPLDNNALDATGNYSDMTLINTPFQEGGIYCNGIYSGNSNYCHAITPEISALDFNNFCISVNFKVDALPSLKMPVIVGGKLYRWAAIYLNSDKTVSLKYNNSNYINSDVNYDIGQWQNAKIVYENNTFYLYLNDLLVVNVVADINHGNDKKITISDFSNALTFKGILDDLKISNINPTAIDQEENLYPKSFVLLQNYPNPFNPTTTINYELSKGESVKIEVFDISGRLIETLLNQYHEPGGYSVNWNASNVGTGVYLYRITAGQFTDVKKCILLK